MIAVGEEARLLRVKESVGDREEVVTLAILQKLVCEALWSVYVPPDSYVVKS